MASSHATGPERVVIDTDPGVDDAIALLDGFVVATDRYSRPDDHGRERPHKPRDQERPRHSGKRRARQHSGRQGGNPPDPRPLCLRA